MARRCTICTAGAGPQVEGLRASHSLAKLASATGFSISAIRSHLGHAEKISPPSLPESNFAELLAQKTRLKAAINKSETPSHIKAKYESILIQVLAALAKAQAESSLGGSRTVLDADTRHLLGKIAERLNAHPDARNAVLELLATNTVSGHA